MEKILKKYKTIPDHLYVRRNADKQLKMIIEEMESPGYVLVARQMGKTNLLFHAKRTLENENRIFVYVDLSSLYEYERDCYQNIIDNIIEQHEEIFEEKELRIKEIRDQKLPPNKEYSRSLRILLKHFNGDIIIILDEIDALRSVDYSDNIFAQIRSSYFNRTSFPEYSKLTYLLSGVIDPSDLIKDKNKSPFNIGEKIYLDDFSFEEYQNLISKSKLNISKDIVKEVYSWTNGNPRLTYDICSEIESNIIDSVNINKELIEKIIKKKYLTNFDLAPIDHIRDRVKSNNAVVEAVINIQKGINNINDEIKQKLYLYGVINSSFDKETVIKNKIILKSLSLEWLNSLTDKSQITITYGLAQFTNKEYKKAVETFIQILNNQNLNEEEKETSNYFLGRAYFYLRDFENAQKYFLYPFKNEIKKREALSLLGMCKLENNFEEAVKLLESIIETETNDFAYHNALLNLAINLPDEEKERRYILLQKLYDSTYKAEDIKENELNKLRTLALYYQFEIHNKEQEIEKSIEKLQQARLYANDSDLLYIIFLEYLLEGDKKLKQELVDKIINNNIEFDIDKTYPISFNEKHLLYYLDMVSDESNLFNELSNYSIEYLHYGKNKYNLIYDVSRISVTNQKKHLNYLLEYKNEIDNTLLVNILRDLSFIYSDEYKSFFKYFDDYLNSFKHDSLTLGSDDLLLFARAIQHYTNSNMILDGLKICKIIEQKLNNIEDEKLKFESLIIYYWYASLYFKLKDKNNTLKYVDLTLKMIDNPLKPETSILDEKGMKTIEDQLKDMKSYFIKRKPIIANKKYNRNQIIKVQYVDGTIVEKKYKKLEKDIASNECKVIESEN